MSKKLIILITIIAIAATVVLLYFFVFRNYNSFPNIGITANGPIQDIDSNIIVSAELKEENILITFKTDKIYPDTSYSIVADYRILDGKIYVEIGGVEKQQGGALTVPVPSTYSFSIPRSAASYPLLIRSSRGEIDKFNMQIKEEKVLLAPTGTPQFTIIYYENI